MKNISTLFIIAVLSFGIFSSCSNEEDFYSLNDIWLSLGFIDTENTSGYDYIIYCDNGDTLFPAANNVVNFKKHNNQRVLINYTILDEVNNAEKKFYVKINNIQEILLKDLVEINDTNTDSLGNNSATITDNWITNNILNIEFQYLGGFAIHTINLAYVPNEEGLLTNPIRLEFKHNANNDSGKHILTNLVSFHLDKLQIEGRNSVDYEIKSIDLFDQERIITGTYKY